jgi:uncharacterized protein YraI
MRIRRLAFAAFAATLAAAGAAGPALAASAYASGKITIFAEPNGNYAEILGMLQAGEVVTIDRCNFQGTWCRVFHAGPTGWVPASYLVGAQAKIEATPNRSLTSPPVNEDVDLGHTRH